MNSMLSIGASKGAVTEAKKTILDIMKVASDLASSDVKIQALKTLHELCSVDGLTITNCTFNNLPIKRRKK